MDRRKPIAVLAIAGLLIAGWYAMQDRAPKVELPPPSTHSDFELLLVSVNGKNYNVGQGDAVWLPKLKELKINLRFRGLTDRMIVKSGVVKVLRVEDATQTVILQSDTIKDVKTQGKETIVSCQFSIPAEIEVGDALLRIKGNHLNYADVLVKIVEAED